MAIRYDRTTVGVPKSTKKKNTTPSKPGDFGTVRSYEGRKFEKDVQQAGFGDEVNTANEEAGYQATLRELMAQRNSNAAGGAGAYSAQLKKMMKQSAGFSDQLLKQLADMSGAARGTIGSSMDELSKYLGGMQNPYAGFQAQQAQVTPELQQLMESQGVSASPVADLATAFNAQNQGQANAFQNLVNSMGGIWSANQGGQLQDVEAMRANLLATLGNTELATGMKLRQQKQANQQKMLMQLLKAMGG